jgi:beta-phosphoglucomutase-like phosphatase (HAD superfamily)
MAKVLGAVIFDMDGVVVDSEPRHERAFLEVMQEIGYGDTHGVHFQTTYPEIEKLLLA